MPCSICGKIVVETCLHFLHTRFNPDGVAYREIAFTQGGGSVCNDNHHLLARTLEHKGMPTWLIEPLGGEI